MAQVDPRDMLNNFCFHVYAQKSLFIVENVNAFFGTSTTSPYPLSTDITVHRADSQLKRPNCAPRPTNAEVYASVNRRSEQSDVCIFR